MPHYYFKKITIFATVISEGQFHVCGLVGNHESEQCRKSAGNQRPISMLKFWISLVNDTRTDGKKTN